MFFYLTVLVLTILHISFIYKDFSSRNKKKYQVGFTTRKLLGYYIAFPVYAYSSVKLKENQLMFLSSIALFTIICLCTVISCYLYNAYTDYLNVLFSVTAFFSTFCILRGFSKLIFVIPILLCVGAVILFTLYFPMFIATKQDTNKLHN